METARIDIRKLQLLNDRIHQVLEALNQVRLTVHGIQNDGVHPGYGGFFPTAGLPGAAGNGMYPGFGYGVPSGQFGMHDPRFGGHPYGWSQETPWTSQVQGPYARQTMFPFPSSPTPIAVGY